MREITAIWSSISHSGICCFAVANGFKYGINSKYEACRYTDRPDHRPYFIDNDFQNYDHLKHFDVVSEHRPELATVRDVMDRRQCDNANTEYYSLDEILRFAEDLGRFAERVIVIPKYDCVADIPNSHILGYAVPTSYGGTDLPYGAFGSRQVHLLGGSWQQQRDIILNSGMNVTSIDFNYQHKIATRGYFCGPTGVEYRLSQAMPGFSSRPLMTCLALSLAAIRTELDKINEVDTIQTRLW